LGTAAVKDNNRRRDFMPIVIAISAMTVVAVGAQIRLRVAANPTRSWIN